jgi:hypothetical protein
MLQADIFFKQGAKAEAHMESALSGKMTFGIFSGC